MSQNNGGDDDDGDCGGGGGDDNRLPKCDAFSLCTKLAWVAVLGQ